MPGRHSALIAVLITALLLVAGRVNGKTADRKPIVAEGEAVLTISLPGVPGPYCMYGIDKRLRALPAVAQVELLWGEDKIRVVARPGATLTATALRAAVEGAQYPYRYSIER